MNALLGCLHNIAHFQTRFIRNSENGLVAGHVGLAIKIGKKTLNLNDRSRGSIAISVLNQA